MLKGLFSQYPSHGLNIADIIFQQFKTHGIFKQISPLFIIHVKAHGMQKHLKAIQGA